MSGIIRFIPGSVVGYEGKKCIILSSIDIRTFCLELPDGSRKAVAKDQIGLEPTECPTSLVPKDQTNVSLAPEEEWAEAKRRYEIFKPLVDKPDRVKADVANAAAQVGLSVDQGYEIMGKLAASNSPAALLRRRRGPRRDSFRLHPDVEKIVDDAVSTVHFKKTRPTCKRVHMEVERNCAAKSLRCPTYNTIKLRLARVNPRESIKKRYGSEAAAQVFDARPGSLSGADYPGAIVQIDHHRMDIRLVGKDGTKAIVRPWVTWGIDVYSRMILGMSLSFESPSTMSVGNCITNMILPKGEWLRSMGLDPGAWPCEGIPKLIHTDNGKEFWSDSLDRACAKYGIDHAYRPVATPRYGAYIERVFRTLEDEIHNLAGTTFSSVGKRAKYDSDAEAAFDIDELEAYMARWATGVYHKRIHSQTRRSPESMYIEAFEGTRSKLAVGALPMPEDSRALKIDFLPGELRTVQRSGIKINHIYYFDECLKPHIIIDPKVKKPKYLVKQDHRKLSPIFFFDPDRDEYIDVHFANVYRSNLSEHQRRRDQRHAETAGKTVDEAAIFEAHRDLAERAAAAVKKTKVARLAANRELRNSKTAITASTPSAEFDQRLVAQEPTSPNATSKKVRTAVTDELPPVEAFDDIEGYE